MKRAILIAAVTLGFLVPTVQGATASTTITRWCGVVSGPDTGFRLRAHNLTCSTARRLAYRYWFVTGKPPRGYTCNQAGTYCWTPGHLRWFRGYQPISTPPPPPPAPPLPPSPPTQGTRSNPWPLGTTAGDASWQLHVNSTDFNAWPTLQTANQFNNPPAPGWTDVLVNLSAQYVGPGSANLSFDFMVNIGYLGSDNVLYRSFSQIPGCGVEPDPNELDYSTLYSGGTATVNTCVQVPIADVGSLELVDSQWSNGFFALR